jgi:hypothetical protein
VHAEGRLVLSDPVRGIADIGRLKLGKGRGIQRMTLFALTVVSDDPQCLDG